MRAVDETGTGRATARGKCGVHQRREQGRLASLLEVAVVRHAETQRLRTELHKAKTSLAERKTVDRAKGTIMRQRNLSEDQAYQLLRKLAMQRNRRVGEVADEVIAAAELLI